MFSTKWDPGKDGADLAAEEGNLCVAEKVVEIVSEGMCVWYIVVEAVKL